MTLHPFSFHLVFRHRRVDSCRLTPPRWFAASLLLVGFLAPAGLLLAGDATDRVHVSEASDPEAIAIAQRALEAMGGGDAWDAARFLQWDFFGTRHHVWDKWTGKARIEADSTVFLINVNTKAGRVWEGGVEVTDPDRRAELLDRGHQIWINDSYWMFMPYKLLDPGVTLTLASPDTLPGGRAADVLRLTFAENAGYTPRNRYDVYVARDTGLVEQWAFYAEATDPEPRFVLPWAGWKHFGGILLATDHGQGKNWNIAVLKEVPESVFARP